MKTKCIKCKKEVVISNPKLITITGTKGERKAINGECPECKIKVFRIVKKDFILQ